MENLSYVIKEMAYDNGAVFRGQTAKDVLDNVLKQLVRSSTNEDGFSLADLDRVENMLSVMPTDDQTVLVAGEHTEIQNLIKSYGFSIEDNMLLDEVLDFAFDRL